MYSNFTLLATNKDIVPFLFEYVRVVHPNNHIKYSISWSNSILKILKYPFQKFQNLQMKRKDVSDIIFKVLTSRMNSKNAATSFPSIPNAYDLIDSVEQIFIKESNILSLNGTFIVVGDIHGNVDDLIRIFEKQGYPPEQKYLFLGDYVDRGDFSVEVLLILYSLKFLFPEHIYLIRGNHESETVTSFYGFKIECSRKYSQKVYFKFSDSFLYLPFAAIINNKYFCVHGGISPQTMNLEELSKIKRPIDNDSSLAITGLVWSDPQKNARGFQKSDRGTGFLFNDQKLNQFLKRNNLELMIRSHEVCVTGMEKTLNKCVTIFSNTNYCGMNNNACICLISEDKNGNYVQYIKFSPLTRKERKKRRIIIPEWILDNDLPTIKEPQSPIVDFSEPSSNIPLV